MAILTLGLALRLAETELLNRFYIKCSPGGIRTPNLFVNSEPRYRCATGE